jgi:hypothetical protein
MRIAVIGGGFSGCVSAFQLARAVKTVHEATSAGSQPASAEHEIVLFEQHRRLGGSVQSVFVHGVCVEVGLWDTFTVHDLRVHELVRRCGLSVQARRASSPAHGGIFASAVLDWPADGEKPLVSLYSFRGIPLLDWLTSVFEHSGLAQLLPFLLAMMAMRLALFHERWLPRLGWVMIGLSFMWMSVKQTPYLFLLHSIVVTSWQRLQLFRRFGSSSRNANLLGAGFADRWGRIFRQGVAYCWSVAQFLQTADMWSWAVTNVAQVCRDARIRVSFAEQILEPVALRDVFGRLAENEAHDRHSCQLVHVNGFAGLRAMAALNLHNADEYSVREGLERLCECLVEQSGARVVQGCRVTHIHPEKLGTDAQALPRWRLSVDGEIPKIDLLFDAVVIACSQPPSITDLDLSQVEHPLREAVHQVELLATAAPGSSQSSDRLTREANGDVRANVTTSGDILSSGSGSNDTRRVSPTNAATTTTANQDANISLTNTAAMLRPEPSQTQGRRIIALTVGRLADPLLAQCGYRGEERFPDLVVFKTPLRIDAKAATTSTSTESTGQSTMLLRPATATELGLVRIERIARIDQQPSPRYLYRLLFLATDQCRDLPHTNGIETGARAEMLDASTAESALLWNDFVRPLFRNDNVSSNANAPTDLSFEPCGIYISAFHSFRCYPLRRHADVSKELVTVLGARLLYPAIIKRLAPGLEMMALGARMTCTLLEDHIRWIVPSATELPRYEHILHSPFNRIGWVE